jgi:hypothetical protein
MPRQVHRSRYKTRNAGLRSAARGHSRKREDLAMASSRSRPATIVVFLEEDAPETHELASDKDWAVIFEDVLEIKSKDGVTYYPLDAVRKWTVA